MRNVFYLFIALSATGLMARSMLGQEASTKPNVLFVAIDDLNDWVEPLGGHQLVKTPNFNRLASRGTTFLNAHCQAPICNPSRTSLMLSLRPSTSGIYSLQPSFRDVPELRERVSLTEYFHTHGYATYMVGKIWHGNVPPKYRDREFTEIGAPKTAAKRPSKPISHGVDYHGAMDWGPFPEHDEDHADFQRAEWAIDRLKAQPSQPFFMAVGFSLPHVPCYAPPKYFDLYPNDNSILPPLQVNDRADVPLFSWRLHWKLPEPRLKWLQEHNEYQPMVRAYLASISFVDAQLGRLLDALDANQQTRNTIVVVWGDHGWHLGEKEISGKNTLWDRSTRVPLLMAGPGVSQNAKCKQPAELLDIYPTLVELCGLPPKSDIEGHSLLPQLQVASTPRPWPAITTQGPNNHGVRSENWRYIRYADGSEELYDIKNDPNEWHNLANAPQWQSVKTEHARWLPEVNQAPVPGSKARLVEYKDGEFYWENQRIPADAPIPQ